MTDGDTVLGSRIPVRAVDLERWCRAHLEAGVGRVLFSEGHLSTVLGIELTSGAHVVVKIRPWADRLRGCAAVHRRLFELGFPCPAPLVGVEPLGDLAASAEALVVGGDRYPSSGRSPVPFARALASLISLAPAPSDVASLDPPPPWTSPGSDPTVLWPPPDDRGVDLNAVAGPPWIDQAARVARARLAVSELAPIVGHADWYTGNLRWVGERLLTAWDWDSVIAAPEPLVVGLAAAVYPAERAGTEATVEESAGFLDAYESARGGAFSDEERRQAWAAGLWNRSFDAKMQLATEGGPKSLTESEALDRQHRAG